MDLIITEFKNRLSPDGKTIHITWPDFVTRLSHPVITDESLDEYASMTNEQKTNIKDVGGYVAGEFENGRRKKDFLKSRYVLTIDADDATPDDIDDYQFYDEPWMYCVHSTHTSTEKNPRLRWLFLLSRPVEASEYRRLIKYVSQFVGANTLDETTDQPERLMFWPSASWDADYTFVSGGTEPLDVDATLEKCPEIAEEQEDLDTEALILSGVIPEGSRDNTTFRIACQLRRMGFNDELVLSTIKEFNKAYCEPKLPLKDIKRIAAQACKFSPGDIIRADDLSESDAFGDFAKVKKKERPKKEVESGTDLLNRYIAPAKYYVEGMVTTGMGLVVAPPKFGKSWFALDLAISVATGTEFFGKKTRQAGVLYYALEDNDRRLQTRLSEVAGDRKNLDHFYHIEEAPSIENGLFDDIENNLMEHPEIELIVIDTLQKVRGSAKKTEGAYGYDYRETGEIQRFAFDHELSILLVHHTRKIIDPNDLVGNVSGTNGVAGAADYVFGMSKKKWNDEQAKLELTGRDVEPQSYIMVFNNHRWECLGKEREVIESKERTDYDSHPLVKTVRYYLDKIERESQDSPVAWEVSPSDLLGFIEQQYGKTEMDSTNKLGAKLRGYEQMFKDNDGITLSKDHKNSGNVYIFTRPRKRP